MAMIKDKDIKKGNIDFRYVNNVVAVKWVDNRGVTVVLVHVLRNVIKYQQLHVE